MRRALLALTVGLALALTGCTATTEPPLIASPTAELTPTAAPTDEGSGLVTVSAAGIQLQAGVLASYDDPLAVIGLMSDLIGVQPTLTVDATAGLVTHQWDGARILERDNRIEELAVAAPELGGMPVVAAGGVAVGSTRADAVAAGATEGADGTLVIDAHDGVAVTLRLDGDSVSEIVAPASAS